MSAEDILKSLLGYVRKLYAFSDNRNAENVGFNPIFDIQFSSIA